MARITVFGPNPMLTVAIERRPGGVDDDLHLHTGGQGVWVCRSAATLGAEPIMCGFIGGETGAVLAPLLERLPGERRLVETAGPSGAYVIDRRQDARELVSRAWSSQPSRHEVDDLFSVTCAAAMTSDALVVCNPLPGELLPLELYANLVADAHANDVPVYVDLSTPRLDSALEAAPEVVKLNDWELAEFVSGPVETPEQMRAAAKRIREHGTRTVVVTRGERPAFVLDGERTLQVNAPTLERGYREGCGDAMMGAMAAVLALGGSLDRALLLGAAAGAATFLRRGLASGKLDVIEELADGVSIKDL